MTLSIRPGQVPEVESALSLWTAADAEPTHTDNNDHQLVGTVAAAWDGWRGSIYRLVVAPSHRRLGLGTRLLVATESRLATFGAVRFQAIVVDTETPARTFWGASDWELQAHRLRFVKG
jgi:ribosomal protein S18 acetylase RimI-like enzyme